MGRIVPVVRAGRLLSLILLLQARGRMSAAALAVELEVSVRTIYRDIEALSGAGVPVFAEAGPGGGYELLDGYRAPLAGLTAEEAGALLLLGVPEPLREIGLGGALSDAHRRVRSAAALGDTPPTALVHLDMPRWFHRREPAPHLTAVAEGARAAERLVITYRSPSARTPRTRVIDPLGLVNKAGVWYVVARTSPTRTSTFRVARIASVLPTGERFDRPDAFDLAGFWETWSEEFEASRPRLVVTLRASPDALAALPEIFGDAVAAALDGAGEPDAAGWRVLTLTFEHGGAAVHRLAGFGDLIEVLSPADVRRRLVATAEATLRRYT